MFMLFEFTVFSAEDSTYTEIMLFGKDPFPILTRAIVSVQDT